MKHLLNALAVCLFLTRVGHAVVVENTNILFGGSPPSNYVIRTYPQPNTNSGLGYNETSFQFDSSQGTFTPTFITLGAIQTDWYVVKAGDIFDSATIAAHQFPSAALAHVDLPDFFLGVHAVNEFAPDSSNAYGWVEIHYNTDFNIGFLQSIDNAIAYYNSGIIVGTLTKVPEPPGYILSLLAAVGLLIIRARF